MELTQIQNVSNMNQVNDVKNNSKTNNLQNIKEVIEKYPSDKIDIEKANSSSSNFLSNVSSNVGKIADLQKQQSAISNQLEITTEVIKTTQAAENSNTVKLDDKQPKIKNLLDNFNKLSESSTRIEISDKPGIYFDGQVGARPLSSKEIHDAIQENKERLSSVQQSISNEIDAVVLDNKNTLETEKTTTQTKVEFKKIDFEKESLQFNSSSINNFKGEVLPSQANAFPPHSEKLLA